MANSDIIKIGFDYRASLEQFEKETNGVFEGISDKAGKQKITIQLDAKDDKVIDKIKELQKLKLDKFTFEFGNSGLKEQLQTFDKLENKINDIISLSKGIDLSFNTKNKTEAYNQLKKYADAFKDYYGNEEAMATNAGAKVGYAYYKAYEEALRKGVAQSKLEKVTIDFDVNDSIFSKERIVENRIKEFENFQKYGNADESNLIAEITLLENRLLKFNSAYSQVKANLGDAPITPEITKNIEEYVRLLEIAESRAKDAELFGYSSEDINSDKDLANMYLDFAKEDATAENKKYIESLKQEETQAIATAEAEQKLAEAQKETVSNTSNSNNSQIEELKSDIQEVKTELGDVKDRISSIESNGFENVRDDVEKTKESVKELNSEFAEMKSNLSSTPQESNISSDISSQVKMSDNITDQIVSNEKKKQEAYKATAETVMYHAGTLSKLNKAETNGRFYGSNRGTGYFGTGHYFVDSNSKHYLDESSTYSKLPYSSIDISQYDNLFKANNDTIAKSLHEFLKNLTRYTQGDTKFNTNELFSQFENVFGNTVMDIKEFESRINGLKDFMSKSNLSDRSDSVSTQFMKSLGYGGVDTRGTKFADTEYGTVIYDLKEESVLQANITDELQKQGQMLEKINYEKEQVFDSSEDSRLQDIINQQEKGKAIREEYNKIYDDTKLDSYSTELSEINKKLDENDEIIGNCRLGIENAEKEAQQFAKEMKELGIEMSNEEIQNSAIESKKSYQERIDELEKERPLLESRRQELEANLDAESKLSKAAMERATATVEDRMKDAFPDKDISASVESATNSIKEENNVLEQNTQKVKENTQAKEQNANVNLNKYDKRLDSYNGKVDKYQATIDRFKDGGWTSKTYLENVQAVKNAVKEYEDLLKELKGKDASLVTSEDINKLDNYEKKIKDTIATVTNMSASEKGYNFVSGQKELDKIHKLLAENSKMSSEAKAKIRAYYAEIENGNPSMSLDKIHGEILKIYNAEVEAGRAGRTLWDTLKNSGFHQIAAQMAGMVGVYDVINLGKEGFNVVRELNTALTEMRKVSDETVQSLKDYQATTFDTADAVGTTAKQIQNSTADWMRLGESMDQAAESAKTANVLLNVSEFDNIEDATKSLVAMGQAYKDLDKMTIVDKLNEVGKIVAQTYSNVWCYKNIAW